MAMVVLLLMSSTSCETLSIQTPMVQLPDSIKEEVRMAMEVP